MIVLKKYFETFNRRENRPLIFHSNLISYIHNKQNLWISIEHPERSKKGIISIQLKDSMNKTLMCETYFKTVRNNWMIKL